MPTLKWSKGDADILAASGVAYRQLEEICPAGSRSLRARSHKAASAGYAILSIKNILAYELLASVPMKDCAR